MTDEPNIEEKTSPGRSREGAATQERETPQRETPEHEAPERETSERESGADEFGAVGARDTDADLPDEASVLRDELDRTRAQIVDLRREVEELRTQADDAREKFLRARADLDNYRRRSAGDVDRAREAGLDSAVLSVLHVYDDLSRALQVADEEDPAKILPGVRAVREALERNLGTLDIQRVGEVGDAFDPDLHEALTSVPSPDEASSGTIADVYQAGFKRGDRLVRPARVVVYAEQE